MTTPTSETGQLRETGQLSEMGRTSELSELCETAEVSETGEQLTRLAPSQVGLLLDGHLRYVRRTRPPLVWPWLRAWAAKAQATAERRKVAATRALRREQEQSAELVGIPRVVRDLPSWLSFLVTALLMTAGLFTLHAILAVADVPELESWLLPLAFGPVFVMSTKIFVGYWLGLVDDDRSAGRRMSRLLIPALLIAFGAAAAGVALKAMVIGTLAPLTDPVQMLSSAVLFGSVVLMEGVGAAALAARQHAPGARRYEAVRRQTRVLQRRADRAVARALRAEARAQARAEWLVGSQEWAAGRGAVGLARGWQRALELTSQEDPLLDQVIATPVQIPAVPTGFVPAPDFDQPKLATRLPTAYPAGDVDAEFRRLLAG